MSRRVVIRFWSGGRTTPVWRGDRLRRPRSPTIPSAIQDPVSIHIDDRLAELSEKEIPSHSAQRLRSILGDDHDVLDAAAADTRLVNPWLDGKRHPRLERELRLGTDREVFFLV